MKIVFITTTSFSHFCANNHLNKTLIQDILDDDIKLHLIQSCLENEDNGIPIEFLNNELFSYTNITKKKVNKNNFLKRGLYEIYFLKNVAKIIKEIKDYDIIFYQTSGLSFYLIKKIKKFKKPILINVQDSFPDSLKTTGILKNKFILSILYRLQRKMYNRVSLITVLSEDMKNNLIQKYSLPKDKIEIIYNWYDERNTHEISIDDNKFAQKYNLTKDKFIIQYAGNLGYVLNYNFIIELAKLLINEKDIEIQIIGNGSNEEKLKNLVRKANLNNIVFYPIQPQEIVPDVYSYCDICLIPLKKGVIYHSVPSKASIVMGCRRPIILICDEDSLYGQIFNDIGCFCNIYDYKKAERFILALKTDSSLFEKYKRVAYDFSMANFSRKVNTKKEIILLKNLVKEK